MTEPPAGTYVYCLIAAARPPAVPRRARGLPGLGRLRLLPVARGRWLVVADAPLDAWSAAAIDRRLRDLDWVSRAALAHEAVVEAFDAARAVLPMKLFTIFASDARAVDHVRGARSRADRLIAHVGGHQEWGVRVAVDPAGAAPRDAAAPRGRRATGAGYLTRKKAQRDARLEVVRRGSEAAAVLFERCAAASRDARRRGRDELPGGTPLLLDAAFLVPRGRGARFRALVGRQARALARDGVQVTLTGPWPPYSFVTD